MKAKQFTSSQCYGKTIQYREVDTDRYGRTVATVYLEDGRELNLEILRAGSAWHYKRYSKRQDYADAEAEARRSGIGCGLIRILRRHGNGGVRNVNGHEVFI